MRDGPKNGCEGDYKDEDFEFSCALEKVDELSLVVLRLDISIHFIYLTMNERIIFSCTFVASFSTFITRVTEKVAIVFPFIGG